MDNNTIDCMNSPWAQIIQVRDKVFIGIELDAVLKGKVILRASVNEEDLLIQAGGPTDEPVTIITPEIQKVYQDADVTHKVYGDVYEYLKIAANMWSSGNKTASAITGSLIGKISKSYTSLNETLFSRVGGEKRDTLLKELLKCNMSKIEYFWGIKKN